MAEQTIGIDAGGSMLKLAYVEKGQLHVKKYPYQQLASFTHWLALVAQDARFVLTGAKAATVESALPKQAESIEEFTALNIGSTYLLSKYHSEIDQACILVNIGTGTSLFTKEGDRLERITGTGMGGGALMGLAALLTGEGSFDKVIETAEKGDRAKVDLQVKDIYTLNPPIPGHLTASNFGKITANTNPDRKDVLAALVGAIGETTVLLAKGAADLYQVKDVVYLGGVLTGNKLLEGIIADASEFFSCTPHFLEKGEYCGAIGAMLHGE